MIRFLFKGLIRDRSRSLFPLLTVTIGVMLTVVMFSWLSGAVTNMIESSANFSAGHVKIMSLAYAEGSDQVPNDLAFIGVEGLTASIRKDYPDMLWTPRIRFGGLIDIPDENGETRSQGPVAGLAVDILSPTTPEVELLNLDTALVRGRLPEKPGEVVLSDDFARRLEVEPGEIATLISSTMGGSMATDNFVITGTIRFGISAMDRGAMLADISDIQRTLDMTDAAGEILGFSSDHLYDQDRTQAVAADFNARYSNAEDEFSPVMKSFREQGGLAQTLDMFSAVYGLMLVIFVAVMSIVLWNAGLMGSLRRYGEIGLRLAIGEDKGHVYRSMIAESLMIGTFGTLLGTAIGLAISYYIQAKGIDISSMMKNASIIIGDVMRSKVTPVSYVIGFIPGLAATFLGTAISGIGIFRRQTSQLAKELES